MIRASRTTRSLALTGALLVVGAGCGGGSEEEAAPTTTVAASTTSSTRDVAADTSKAAKAVLVAADLPGYAVEPGEEDGEADPTEKCFATTTPVVQKLEADPTNKEGEDFAKGAQPNTTQVSSKAVYTATQADAVAAIAEVRSAAPGLASCLQSTFGQAIGVETPAVKVDVKVLPSTASVPGADETVGLSLQLTIAEAGTSVSGGGDVLVFRKDRGIGTVSYLAFGSPSLGEAARLGGVVAARL